MSLGYLKLPAKAEKHLNMLDDVQRGRMLTAMMDYAILGKETVFDHPSIQAVWLSMKEIIDREEESHNESISYHTH